jgi:hypothetical protein
LGVAALSIFYGIICILPRRSALREQVVQFRWENMENLNYEYVNRRVILPFIIYLWTILIVPSLIYVMVTYLFGKKNDTL